MLNNNALGSWIRRFLMEHIVRERNLSRNTQTSYRDTLALLLPFVAGKAKKQIDRLNVQDLSADAVRLFLHYLEQERNCSIATRNTRLAAIHAFAYFVAEHGPEHLDWCTKIRAIPFKRSPKTPATYLGKLEMDALLNVPDRNSVQGTRDYLMLLFLYNTGARADEAARLTIGDLNLIEPPSVKLVGKGNKTRICPLWSLTTNLLTPAVTGRSAKEPVFLNRRHQPITRFGIYALVKRCVRKATQRMAGLGQKRISPHSIRHTTAMHLLRAGVDINTIRAWLGHVSIDTTNIYAEIDLEMKANALAHCEILAPSKHRRPWRENTGLMEFLKTL